MKHLIIVGMIAGIAGSLISCPEVDAKQRVNQRQCNQQKRVYNGVQSGALTQKEAAKLQRRQYQLAKTEQAFRRSGGGLTRAERVKLENGQDALSRNVYHQKHDAQTKP